MNEITLAQAAVLTSPNPVTLICTQKPDGGTNYATVSWWTYLSFHPNMVAFAMSKKSYSGERIRETKKAIITIPGESLARQVMSCGSTSGRTVNKEKEFEIEPTTLPASSIQIPKHSRVAITCDLKDYVEVGDHYLYIFNVANVYGDDIENALFAWEGYRQVNTAERVVK